MFIIPIVLEILSLSIYDRLCVSPALLAKSRANQSSQIFPRGSGLAERRSLLFWRKSTRNFHNKKFSHKGANLLKLKYSCFMFMVHQ